MKIARMDETEIYINQEGAIAIRQISPMGEDDQVVSFPPEMLSVIVAEMQRLAEEAKNVAADIRSRDE
jgi:hypothetical protein